jgi:two-component system phosphate regulon sensor histidine kinase PhoR
MAREPVSQSQGLLSIDRTIDRTMAFGLHVAAYGPVAGVVLAVLAAVLFLPAALGLWAIWTPLALLLGGLAGGLLVLALLPPPRLEPVPATEAVLPPPVSALAGRLERLWRQVVDAIPDAAVALDGEGIVLHHNARAVALFDRLRAGQPLSRVLRHPELLDAVDRCRDAPGSIEVQMVEHVPVERRLAARLSPLAAGRESDGGPGPVLLITIRDLSEQDRLTQMRADFVANASHELRTPLAALKGYVETLQGAARNDPVARERFLITMAEQASRMTRLIDDLLSLSRIEMRQHLPPVDLVDLNVVAQSTVRMLEPVAAAAKASIQVVPLDGPAIVRGDREEIVQALHNLIYNAVKYGREGGSVEIKVSRETARRSGQPRIAVSIADDGPGIAAEHLPRLTERFYRVSTSASRDKGGTGLGLAIVKHVMNRHHGDLRVASKVGAGSTFTLVLDAAVS